MSPSSADFIDHPPTTPQPFRLGEWLVNPGSGEIADGRSVLRIEPKAMDVLAYLAAHPGEVVSREELERHVWHGALVGYDAVTSTVVKLRKALGDDPHRPTYIATVPKRGYRLLPGVESHPEPGWDVPTGAIQQRHRKVGDDPAHPRALLTSPDDGSRLAAPVSAADRSLPLEDERTLERSISGARRLIPAVLLFCALGLAAAGAFVWFVDHEPPVATKDTPSDLKTIAVLPFRNLTGDPADDYFAEGMGDDLITSLARFSNLRVIARDSSSLYADEPASLRDVGDRLNARYLLRGSVRRTADNLRISVQLMDARSGSTLWAESFDDHPERVFQLQDRITHRTVAALAGRMNVQDRQELGRPRTKNLQAYDDFLFGRQRFFQYASAEENRKAREAFERAIALDSEFALAYAMLGWTYAFDAMNGWAESRQTALERAKELASQAIARDDSMPVAYFVRGLAYRELGDPMHAQVEAQKAIDLDPNYASAHVLLATLLYFNGKAKEGLDLIKRAIALNPHHPYNYNFHLGQAYYILRQYDAAIDAFEGVLKSNPAAERVHLWLAAAYAQTGRDDDAAWEMDQVQASDEELSLERIRHAYPFKSRSDLEHLVVGLRKAGLTD